MTVEKLLSEIKKWAESELVFIEDTAVAFHVGGDKKPSENALKLCAIVEIYQAALECVWAGPTERFRKTVCKNAIAKASAIAGKGE